MSELSEELANVNDGQLGESLAAMERRHKVEIRKLEGETRALLKTAKKSNRAVIEAQVIQMQYDLKERHKQERDELEALGGLRIRKSLNKEFSPLLCCL